jgi:hypothetical protein
MQRQYDFSEGVKGKFNLSEADIEIPVYLEEENRQYFLDLSRKKNTDLSRLINDTLDQDRERIDAAQG